MECVVNLPAKLFLNTQIPACLWFMRRGKKRRKNEILFIDARNLGELVNRRTKILTPENIKYISDIYHNWQNKKEVEDNSYQDIAGFCKSVSKDEVAKLDYVLTPGRYVGLEEIEDDFDFKERFNQLQKEFESQLEEEKILNDRITQNLKKIKI